MVAELWFKAHGGNVEKAPSSNEEPGDPWECHLALYLGFQYKESSKLERLFLFRKAFVIEQYFGRELSERSVMDPVEFSFQFHLDEGQSFV
jgi:hypothetical protein